MEVTEDQQLVLTVLVKGSGTGNVMEILQWAPEKFEKGFLLANELQNLDAVKLLYSNFNKNLIVVELTLVGEAEGKRISVTR